MVLKIAFLVAFASFASSATYENYNLFRVNVSTPFQAQMLRQYVDRGDHITFDAPTTKTPFLIAVQKDFEPGFYLNVETSLCADIEKVQDNIQEWFEKEAISQPDDPMSWDRYHSLPQIHRWQANLTQTYPQLVSSIDIGQAYEGRHIRGTKIETNPNNPIIIVEANANAREWITSATATWLINELLTSEDPMVRNLRETIDWHIFPVVNPDGFYYSRTTDRVWRKTRRPNPYTDCVGTDLSRNFPFKWNSGGASNNPCGMDYAGPNPLSEIEAAALANYVNKNAKKITAYLSFDSTSQRLMYPFSTRDQPPLRNEEQFEQIGQAMVSAMEAKFGTKYGFGNVADSIYEASGNSVDWVKGVHDIPFVWQYGFRNTESGFAFPHEQIVENAQEVLESIVTFVQEARKIGYFPQA